MLDDKLPHHRKVREIRPALMLPAFGLHAAALCFCQNYGTDGVIRRADFPLVTPTRPKPPTAVIAELVRVRLWERHPDGWQIHDYLSFNASAAERRAKAEQARSAAMRRWHPPSHAERIAGRNAIGNASPLLSSPTPTPLRKERNPRKDSLSGANGLRPTSIRVLECLNEQTGKRFEPVPANLNLIKARLREGATEQNCRGVIFRKCREWAGDPKMAEYLRPKTLFNATNFAQYLGQRDAPIPDDAEPEVSHADER